MSKRVAVEPKVAWSIWSALKGFPWKKSSPHSVDLSQFRTDSVYGTPTVNQSPNLGGEHPHALGRKIPERRRCPMIRLNQTNLLSQRVDASEKGK